MSPDSNCEAILNIFANGADILGKSGGTEFLLGALSVLFLKKKLIAGKLAAVGILALLVGFVTPGTIAWIVASVRDANIPMSSAEPWLWIIGIIGLLGVLAFAIISALLPTIIAFKTDKQNKKLVLILNILLLFIPLGWNVALFISLKDDKAKRGAQIKPAAGA
jgi:hypothetical protein